jgi:hypothetical protein
MDALRLYAIGIAFEKDRLSLRETVKLLEITRMLLDTGLLISAGKEKMSADLRDNIKYDLDLRTGSLDAYISMGEIAKDVVPLMLPMASDIAARFELILGTLKHAKALIEWLGAKRNAKQQVTIKVNIEVKNSPGATVLVATDGDVYNTTQAELNNALKLFQPYKEMALMCDGKDVETIDYYSRTNGKDVEKALSMDKTSKELYRTEKLIEDLTMEIVGTIFDFNTKTGKGKIELTDGKVYNISVSKSVDVHRLSLLAYDKGPVECKARPVMKIRNGVPTLNGYEIIDFNQPAQKNLNI